MADTLLQQLQSVEPAPSSSPSQESKRSDGGEKASSTPATQNAPSAGQTQAQQQLPKGVVLGPDGKPDCGATYYRMVTAFAHRVRMYARMHSALPLRENLNGLLEGTAQEWWTDAVEQEEQLYYMTQADGIEAWLKHLEEHFAPSPEEAEAHLEALTYTPADARKGKSVEEYLASIRAAVRAFNEDARDADIVYRAWKQLHPRLRRKVDRPEKTVTFAELRRLLKTKQPMWKTLPEKDGDVPGGKKTPTRGDTERRRCSRDRED
ncbi:hypothetical protein KEM55_002547 [Ascosphaera atra]|nr:hypothetical protein KEM55_002547 [Ascosphaera atra]